MTLFKQQEVAGFLRFCLHVLVYQHFPLPKEERHDSYINKLCRWKVERRCDRIFRSFFFFKAIALFEMLF